MTFGRVRQGDTSPSRLAQRLTGRARSQPHGQDYSPSLTGGNRGGSVGLVGFGDRHVGGADRHRRRSPLDERDCDGSPEAAARTGDDDAVCGDPHDTGVTTILGYSPTSGPPDPAIAPSRWPARQGQALVAVCHMPHLRAVSPSACQIMAGATCSPTDGSTTLAFAEKTTSTILLDRTAGITCPDVARAAASQAGTVGDGPLVPQPECGRRRGAIAAAGLMRYGYTVEVKTIALGLLRLLHAAEAFDGRRPELFCGFDDFAVPVSYRPRPPRSPPCVRQRLRASLFFGSTLRLRVRSALPSMNGPTRFLGRGRPGRPGFRGLTGVDEDLGHVPDPGI